MTNTVTISELQFEHYPTGLGVSHASPRLSWRFDGDARDWTQVGYEVRVTRNGKAETFAVDSAASVLVPWPSEPLASRDAAHVEVRSRGADGWTNWTAADVEAAFLDRSDWKATLSACSEIGKNGNLVLKGMAMEQVPDTRDKKPYRLRKTFTLDTVPKTSRLYVTAQGVHTTYINGHRLPDLLEPGWTSYQRNINYRAYDVAPFLQPGKNVIASWIGEGWFSTRLTWGGGVRDNWGHRPALLAQLEGDGQVLAATGDGWEWSYGATTQGEIYDGETFDSNVDDVEWLTADKPAGEWKKADSLPLPDTNLVTPEIPPIREYDRLKVVEVITTPSGKTVLDFGQNFAGHVEIVAQPTGTGTLVLRHAEVLEKGELGVRPLRVCKATDNIILGGKVAGWQPKFTFHGFRYVQVSGWTAPIKGDEFVGVAISSNCSRTGQFDCSHPKINRLHENVVWSMRANTISVPTDCPQRDERMGWTGDAQVITPTFNFLFDSAGFLRNWLRDLRGDQAASNGCVPIVIPSFDSIPMFSSPHAVWGDVAALMPNDLYTSFGDKDILAESFESMKSWLGAIPRSDVGLWDTSLFQFADWLDPKAPPERAQLCTTDPFLVTDAYLIHTTRTVAKVARVLGKDDEAAKYDANARELLQTFHDLYITKGNRVVSDTQTALSLILQFDLVDPARPEQKEALVKRLALQVSKEEWQVATGFAGTPLILPTLAANGLTNHAYRMLLSRDCPSWMYQVLMGATTMWERWDSMLPDGTINPGEMTSFNHYAFGAVAAFMHNTIGGLSPLEAGWKKALIKPQPGANLTHASVEFKSPYGKYAVSWRLNGDDLSVEVEVPPNASAVVELPGVNETVGSGTRSYKVKWEAQEWPPKSLLPNPMPGGSTDDKWVKE